MRIEEAPQSTNTFQLNQNNQNGDLKYNEVDEDFVEITGESIKKFDEGEA